ncbi:translation initiation factor IF-2-like [Myiozetetes cayanensis]|uniref:translation initiation factor IF-2-like n=1 Tax=Myiozetetes cayanensis TaxID=478635 RepID=UPI00215E8297|nr:translation initiation factor IF-2-like [Myiozetetes cayanensis]
MSGCAPAGGGRSPPRTGPPSCPSARAVQGPRLPGSPEAALTGRRAKALRAATAAPDLHQPGWVRLGWAGLGWARLGSARLRSAQPGPRCGSGAAGLTAGRGGSAAPRPGAPSDGRGRVPETPGHRDTDTGTRDTDTGTATPLRSRERRLEGEGEAEVLTIMPWHLTFLRKEVLQCGGSSCSWNLDCCVGVRECTQEQKQ